MTIPAIEFNILIIASMKFGVGRKKKKETKQNKTIIIVINEWMTDSSILGYCKWADMPWALPGNRIICHATPDVQNTVHSLILSLLSKCRCVSVFTLTLLVSVSC